VKWKPLIAFFFINKRNMAIINQSRKYWGGKKYGWRKQ
jgi:hypothetical protein